GREEAVAIARRPTRRPLAVAADDDRHARLLHRLRVRHERPPAEELPRERLRRLLPERADGAHRLARARGALREWGAEGADLLGGAREVRKGLRVTERAGVGVGDAEFHDGRER